MDILDHVWQKDSMVLPISMKIFRKIAYTGSLIIFLLFLHEKGGFNQKFERSKFYSPFGKDNLLDEKISILTKRGVDTGQNQVYSSLSLSLWNVRYATIWTAIDKVMNHHGNT